MSASGSSIMENNSTTATVGATDTLSKATKLINTYTQSLKGSQKTQNKPENPRAMTAATISSSTTSSSKPNQSEYWTKSIKLKHYRQYQQQ
eukprot:CAMPEP_0115040586 /NCGR_PEP_ID=MMETSP0216-20121206/44918_1 /TAXON_ID=223996 /ORGANISM="Protocruzia adherens, Strain Boccale" /LENGTH=90 /DNA_ID=CAMNT_0002421857 /DNA_START=148 /DNA_END=420 /DNA_ORIENTATION=-